MLKSDKNALEQANCNSEVELVPDNGRRSFYGKGTMLLGKNGYRFCRSYRTIVAMATPNGSLVRVWNGYSPTTMSHISSFCVTNGISSIGKKVWDKMKVGKRYTKEQISELA